jgi:hypothetical protein
MKYWLYLFSFFIVGNAFSQADTIKIDSVNFVLEKKIEVKGNYFTTDQLGFIYSASSDKLTKFNSEGKLIFQQSYKSMGDISFIDATQSLRTLIFYRDLTQILFVDNTLSIQGESIKLEKEGFPFVTLACASFMNNHFWIYSTDEFMIKRLDKSLKEISTSGNITQLTRKELNPDFIMEAGDYVYLHDSLQGILQFDLFGTYIQTLPIKNIANFQVEQNTILYLENGYLLAYSLKDFSLAKMELPNPGVKQFRKVDNKLIFSYEDGIEIYRLEKK